MTRHEARGCALQALYQIEVGGADTLAAISHVLEERNFNDADLAFIRHLVEGTLSHLVDIDELLKNRVQGWDIERIGRVELNVLRLGVFELKYSEGIDVATVLNEAVQLAKDFSTEASGRFVNGVFARILNESDAASSSETDE